MIEFAWPWLFLLIPLPWLWRWLLPAAKPKPQVALQVPFYKKLVDLYHDSNKMSCTSSKKKILAYAIWILLIIAAASPRWYGAPMALPRVGRNIMLAMDLSGSMEIKDMKLAGHAVDRLSAIKALAGEFIEQRQGDRLGLILFGTHAYLQTPMTFDLNTVKHMLDDATIGLAGERTAIGDAIGLAIKRLMKQPKGNRVLILLTDGVNNAGNVNPIDAARMAAKQDIRIYTIGFGAQQMVVPSFFGPQAINPSADLDVKTLENIAQITGGLFFRAKNIAALAEVYQRLNQLEPIDIDKSFFRPVKHLYPWPLGLALLLSILMIWHRLRPRQNSLH